jgi:hypothetical protein
LIPCRNSSKPDVTAVAMLSPLLLLLLLLLLLRFCCCALKCHHLAA